ncbi:hypothetical protein ABIE27_001959 [Paenibacillus sp. 4624]|uniref:hypothetical protein n=1 Tax=Paenibacillus sp. 4624 TaxID=3156453 RepID=UPI003D254721
MEEQLIRELAKKLSVGLKQLKLAQKRDPKYGELQEVNLLEGLDELIEDLDGHGGIYSQYDLNLNAQEYWTDVVRSQIDIIGIACGSETLRKVHNALEEIDGNNEYNYQSGFNICADGLHGWHN